LATRLRKVGADAALDQWDLGPGDDIPLFMERNLAVADRVIMVCTENYVQKANAGAGGVGFEKMIITADLLRRIDSNKVIPIIRQNGPNVVPTFLRSKMYVDFSREDQYESSIDDLTRSIHNAPLFVKPEISISPFEPVASSVKRTGDALLELMQLLMQIFEAQRISGFLMYDDIAMKWSGSRTMLDILLEQAKTEGLIRPMSGWNYIEITLRGKMYAVENRLIQ